MTWTVPAHPKREVDEAGATYVDPSASAEDRAAALEVIHSWRAAHGFPLSVLRAELGEAARGHDGDPIVAQRLKRLPSIAHKLERMPGMRLSRMQDVGGARAIVGSVDAVREVAEEVRGAGEHELVRESLYIDEPRPSGYRGVHLVYAYRGEGSPYDGLRVELQIRSSLQHAWATAVETVGTFTRQALKSRRGDAEWLRFFALMSSALALREGTPPVPDTPRERGELVAELRALAAQLKVVERLRGFGAALRLSEEGAGDGHALLLELDAAGPSLFVRSFDDMAVAIEAYDALEREDDSEKDIVLVGVGPLAALRRAYPNYFLDTTVFLESLEEEIG